MNKDILKGKWLEIQGRIKRSEANSPIAILARSKEQTRNFWGFYRRNMDIIRDKAELER